MTILIGKTKKILTIYTLTKNRTPETPDRIGDDWSATSALEKIEKKTETQYCKLCGELDTIHRFLSWKATADLRSQFKKLTGLHPSKITTR